jgi:dTDP-glucose 4,6-dehydratase
LKLLKDLQHILAHTDGIWEELRGKTIFVTGGTGFFGKWILESFIYANETLGLGAKMIVLSRNPQEFLKEYPHFKKNYIQFITGDILHFGYPDEPIHYIIHAAADMSGYMDMDKAAAVFDSIVTGTERILELARVKQVKAVLHTSSGAVYGVQPHVLSHIPETFSGAPDVFGKNAAYGEGKRVAEMLANMYYHTHGVESKVARCFAFVGPYMADPNFAIVNFINSVVKGDDIVIKGDGTPFRSYLYAADLAIWLWHILVNGKSCRPYNVGSDEHITIENLAREVASFSKTGNCSVEILSPKSNSPALRYVPDIKRAKDELNLAVYIDLKEGINRAIGFYTP